MEAERWIELMDSDSAELTDAELSEGWHWCEDWGDMLVGPGMHEYEMCDCGVKEER